MRCRVSRMGFWEGHGFQPCRFGSTFDAALAAEDVVNRHDVTHITVPGVLKLRHLMV